MVPPIAVLVSSDFFREFVSYLAGLSALTLGSYIVLLTAAIVFIYALIRVALLYRRDCALGRCWLCGRNAGEPHAKDCRAVGGIL